MTLTNVTLHDANVLEVYEVTNTEITNFIGNNLTLVDVMSHSLIDIEYDSSETLIISNFLLTSSTIDSMNSILRMNIPGATATLQNLVFDDLTLSDSVSLLMLIQSESFEATNLTFTNSAASTASDVSNLLINLENIASQVDNEITFNTILVENTPISVLSVANGNQLKTISQQLTVNNLVIQNTNYEFSDPLILTRNVKTENLFYIEMNSVTFQNLVFESSASLMSLGHQTPQGMTINDLFVQDVEYAGINIEASDQQSGQEDTIVLINNFTAHYVYPRFRSLIGANTMAHLTINGSKFFYVNSIDLGTIVYAGLAFSTVEIYDSDFYNNTSIEGGIFVAESGSVVKCTRCNITQNFAMTSGVIKINENGYMEFYDSTIYNNYAYINPVADLTSSAQESILDGCTLTNNIILSSDFIINNLLQQEYIPDEVLQFYVDRPNLLSQTVSDYIFQVSSSELKISGNTTLTGQDYFMSIISSTLTIDGLIIQNQEFTKSVMRVVQTNANISGLIAQNITADPELNLLELVNSEAVVTDMTYTDSNLTMIFAPFSTVSIDNIDAQRITGVQNMILVRS